MAERARKILSKVHPDFSFKLKNGGEIKNLEELVYALKTMNKTTFQHHVTKDRNDFMNWVRDIVKDEELAVALEDCYDQLETEKIVRNRIMELQARIQKHEDLQSFEELLPIDNSAGISAKNINNKEEENESSNSNDDEETEDIKGLFDFKSIDDIKLRLHTIATGALFGLILGLVLGYIFGKL